MILLAFCRSSHALSLTHKRVFQRCSRCAGRTCSAVAAISRKNWCGYIHPTDRLDQLRRYCGRSISVVGKRFAENVADNVSTIRTFHAIVKSDAHVCAWCIEVLSFGRRRGDAKRKKHTHTGCFDPSLGGENTTLF